MEETKKLAIPDGYEFDRVENGEVILKRTSTALPKAWNEIRPLLGEMDCLTVSVPDGMGDATRILCDLICARNAWWKQLEWEPNWNDEKEPFKWCIHSIKGVIEITSHSKFGRILAFPTRETASEFLSAFRDLIEEAKELL